MLQILLSEVDSLLKIEINRNAGVVLIEQADIQAVCGVGNVSVYEVLGMSGRQKLVSNSKL